MTVENLCWIVGTAVGLRFEDELVWARKIMGPEKSARVSLVRCIVWLVLVEVLQTSQREAMAALGRKHPSQVTSGLRRARNWRAQNPTVWDVIVKSVKDIMEREAKALGAGGAR